MENPCFVYTLPSQVTQSGHGHTDLGAEPCTHAKMDVKRKFRNDAGWLAFALGPRAEDIVLHTLLGAA